MPASPSHLCAQVREFLDDDAVVISVTTSPYTAAWATHTLPSGMHAAVDPAELAGAALKARTTDPDRQVLILCEAETVANLETQLATLLQTNTPVVLLLVGEAAAWLQFAEAQGGHVQAVDDMDDLQTALAAAFISGDTGVIACHIAVAESPS